MIYLITFPTTHGAMAAELLVEDLGNCRLVSLPPQISAGCGLSLLIRDPNVEDILKILRDENISISGVYEKTGIQEYKEYGGKI